MKIWIDDIRQAPDGYAWCKTTNEAIWLIKFHSMSVFWGDDIIELIDLDHDAGDFAKDGGDYIKILDFLEEQSLSYPIHLHSMNPVGLQNMRTIIERNGWTEIK